MNRLTSSIAVVIAAFTFAGMRKPTHQTRANGIHGPQKSNGPQKSPALESVYSDCAFQILRGDVPVRADVMRVAQKDRSTRRERCPVPYRVTRSRPVVVHAMQTLIVAVYMTMPGPAGLLRFDHGAIGFPPTQLSPNGVRGRTRSERVEVLVQTTRTGRCSATKSTSPFNPGDHHPSVGRPPLRVEDNRAADEVVAAAHNAASVILLDLKGKNQSVGLLPTTGIVCRH